MTTIRSLPVILAALVQFFPALVSADVEIKANAVKKSATKHEEIRVIRIELGNSSGAPTGPLALQYRYSSHSEYGPDGRPEGALTHKEGSATAAAILLEQAC